MQIPDSKAIDENIFVPSEESNSSGFCMFLLSEKMLGNRLPLVSISSPLRYEDHLEWGFLVTAILLPKYILNSPGGAAKSWLAVAPTGDD